MFKKVLCKPNKLDFGNDPMMFQGGDEPNLALLMHLGVSKESKAWICSRQVAE